MTNQEIIEEAWGDEYKMNKAFIDSEGWIEADIFKPADISKFEKGYVNGENAFLKPTLMKAYRPIGLGEKLITETKVKSK